MPADQNGSERRRPVLLLHGTFGRPGLMDPWIRTFEDAGYSCHAPTLPGRDPSDDEVLRRTSVRDCVDVALAAYDELDGRPIVIGHSFGGLLAQKVAAARTPSALVLLASVPPGILRPQVRALPHLVPLMPSILGGRPLLPGSRTMRAVPLNTLAPAEQDVLIPRLVRDSGRVFRALILGAPSTRVPAADVTCPVLCISAGADRNVAGSTSRRIAARYRAEHRVHPGLPHWIVAESVLDEVAPPVLEWLGRVVE